MSPSDKQIIFSLIGVGRVYPPKKQVLKDIYLSFYYGAKIGVLGLNGAGKSTLLRIIAGVDKDGITISARTWAPSAAERGAIAARLRASGLERLRALDRDAPGQTE